MGNCLVMPAKRRPEQDEDLLPGILDHIVWVKIVPKLHWEDFHRLSSVSRAWNNVVRSRQVFDSRVLFNSSSDTVIGCYSRWFSGDNSGATIALYSTRENCWRTLPPIYANIKKGKSGVREHAQCISLDRKIYVLGGSINHRISGKVFVFDLAGGGKWKRCASMKEGRSMFKSVVIDGKIYVFDGVGAASRLKSEVYDPKENTWSRIRRTTTYRYHYEVTQIGQALCIYGGGERSRDDLGYNYGSTDSLEAYHPFKDEWLVLRHRWNRPKEGVIFSARGNVFSIQQDDTHGTLRLRFLAIDKYDVHGDSWIRVQSFSFVALIPVEYYLESPRATWSDAFVAVDDELIVLLRCIPISGGQGRGLCVFQSTGFGSKDQSISWKLIAITFERPNPNSRLKQRVEQYFVQLL